MGEDGVAVMSPIALVDVPEELRRQLDIALVDSVEEALGAGLDYPACQVLHRANAQWDTRVPARYKCGCKGVARIAIVASAWLPRVLLRAELEEAGHEVTGYESLTDGIVPLRMGLQALDLVIFDTLGADLDASRLRELRLAAGPTPVLILTGHYDAGRLDFEALGFPHRLVRPVFVGSVVEAAERLLGER